MADYTLNWSSNSLKQPFTLTGGTIDISTTSLALTGKGSVNWGERLQENLLHLMENFASPTPPNSPTIGQKWFNSTTGRMNVYLSGGTWSELSWRRIDSPTTPTGTHYPGDLWYDTTTDLLKIYTKNGNWAFLASAVGSPAGAGGAAGTGGGTNGYESLSPSFAPFTGAINVTRTQVVDSVYTSIAEADLQLQNGSYYVLSVLASGNSLPPVLSSYVNYLNNTVGQIRIKNLVTERWDDAGLSQISVNNLGLINAKNSPGTIVQLFADNNTSIVAGFTFTYTVSVSYNATAKKYTFYHGFKVTGSGAYAYSGTVPTNAITLNGVFQYLKPNGVGSSMPSINQVSFG